MRCEDCGKRLKLEVLHSNAGYYVGTQCECGPYSRDSEYFKNPKDAQEAFEEMREFL